MIFLQVNWGVSFKRYQLTSLLDACRCWNLGGGRACWHCWSRALCCAFGWPRNLRLKSTSKFEMCRTMVFLQVCDLREKRRPKKRSSNCIYPGIKVYFCELETCTPWLHDIAGSCLPRLTFCESSQTSLNRARETDKMLGLDGTFGNFQVGHNFWVNSSDWTGVHWIFCIWVCL